MSQYTRRKNTGFRARSAGQARTGAGLLDLVVLLFFGSLPQAQAAPLPPVVAGAGQDIAVADDSTIQGNSAGGTNGAAIYAHDGGKVAGSNLNTFATATDAPSVIASGTGSLITLTGSGTVLNAAHVGAWMDGGGLVKLGDGTTINVTGASNGSAGIRVRGVDAPADTFGSGIVINIDSGSTNTNTNNAWIGVSVDSPADFPSTSATFNNLTVQGQSATLGVVSAGLNTVTNLNNSNITINGEVNPANMNIWTAGSVVIGLQELGVAAISGGILNINNSNIAVNSTGSNMGVYVRDTTHGATVNLHNTTVTMRGPAGSLAGAGIFVQAGTANADNVRVDTVGDNYSGLRVADSGTINANALQLNSYGANSNLVRFQSTGSVINLTDSNLVAYGAGTIGIATSTANGRDALFNMSGGSLTSTAQAIDFLSAAPATSFYQINLSNGVQVKGGPMTADGPDILLNAASGNGVLRADSGTRLHGDMQAVNPTSVQVAMNNRSAWSGAARNIGAVGLDGESVWNLTGNSDVQSLSLASSLVDFSGPASGGYKTLTVRGNYSATEGVVALNTYLGDSNSPTDQLIVAGNTAGSSLLRIKNTDGGGALTGGEGIPVVLVQGASDGSFRLQDRVAAGLYEYTLHRGGNDGDWYLSSAYQPVPNPPSPEPLPNIRPEVPLATALVPLGREFGYSMLDTLHQRVGESRRVTGNEESAQPDEKWFTNAWGRALGNRLFHNAGGNFMNYGVDYDYTMGGVQAGLDIYSRQSASGSRDHLGTYVGYGHLDADVAQAYAGKAGTADLDGYTVGGYWTHYSSADAKGWYSDAVVQGTVYDARSRSNLGERMDVDGYGLLASLEGGYAFDLGRGYTLEPQAQIAFQNVVFDDAKDSYGNFSFDDGSSLRGRVGLRLARTWNRGDADKPREQSVWLRTNLWKEFSGDSDLTVSALNRSNPAKVKSRSDDQWGEIGLGISGQVSDKLSLFATGGYTHSLGGDGSREGWDARVGIVYRW
ncbi:autotransporter outer membrane beta-barrel domain-containing protein [Desulfobulbus sp.]|uniref:autotransporter family protein n=1 Tax=Desulfobulbus sp. TaxID=895 RepID=UPI00286F64D6|nr:autotransporter outer membrane beta-barrel domain-containing protein [Desulfobulbus sp.]